MMEKLILERSFTQQVYVLEVEDSNPRRYRIQFSLSPSCNAICRIDFGLDGELRVYEIEGRQRAESLMQLGEFLSHDEWLKELIERKLKYSY